MLQVLNTYKALCDKHNNEYNSVQLSLTMRTCILEVKSSSLTTTIAEELLSYMAFTLSHIYAT